MNTIKYFSVMWLLIAQSTFLPGQKAFDAIHIMDNEIGFGTRSLAMGGAYTGLADDYTAIYWNPAGLGDIDKAEIFTELSHLKLRNEALFANKLTIDDQTYTRFRSFGFAFPLPTERGSLVLAFGYNRIVDYDENLFFSGFSNQSNEISFDITDDNDDTFTYPFDQNVQRFEQVGSEGGLHQWSFGGAVALSPRFLLGITAAVVGGSEDYQFHFTQKDENNMYNQYPADFDKYKVNRYLSSDFSALSLKIGGMTQLSKRIKFGAVVTLPSAFTIKEVYSSNDELTFDDGYADTTSYSGQWEYDVTTPFYFDAGVSYTSRIITLAGSVRYRDWSQTRFDVQSDNLGNMNYSEYLEENEIIRRNYRPTFEYHLGGEIYLEPLNTKIRGGYAIYPSPLNSGKRINDRKYFTGGARFILDQYVSLDITYLSGSRQRESWDRYTVGGTVEDTKIGKVLIGFTYKL